MANLLFVFDSAAPDAGITNIVHVYDDGTYTAEGLESSEVNRSQYKIEGDNLYYKHPYDEWNLSEKDWFYISFMKLIQEHIEKELLGVEHD